MPFLDQLLLEPFDRFANLLSFVLICAHHIVFLFQDSRLIHLNVFHPLSVFDLSIDSPGFDYSFLRPHFNSEEDDLYLSFCLLVVGYKSTI